jgi:hypothetical protein
LGTHMNPGKAGCAGLCERSQDLQPKCSREPRKLSSWGAPCGGTFLQDSLAKSEQSPIRPLTGCVITEDLLPIPSWAPWRWQTLHPEQMTEKISVGQIPTGPVSVSVVKRVRVFFT